MKKIAFLLLLMTVTFGYTQKKKSTTLGKVTLQELQMSYYEKDSTANALVLYEHANGYVSQKENLDFRTDYYYRIKLFDRNAFERANIKVKVYGDKKIEDIEAFSYHLEDGKIIKTELSSEDIYSKKTSPEWKEVAFTIPNIKEGTVIEYKYSIISPYSSIDDWYFQSDIPKLKSDYSLSYLGNYKYNSRLKGFLKLSRNESKLKRDCVYISGAGKAACANLLYGMDSIPAFKEEDYMVSKENFVSKVTLDLISVTYTDGSVKKYTKTWEDADKSFKNDFFNGQTSKKRFFESVIPESILSVKEPLQKAKGVYKHIQNRFNWNNRYWANKNINIKEAYTARVGGVDAINLSLYNSLQALGIESYIVMIATRNKGVPTRLYPVTYDFNYMIVKTVINGETYFLDATDKFLFFGQIPMRCLNGEGRVLDFEKGSYWENIKPILKNSSKIWIQMSLTEGNEIQGKINVEKKGYFASDTRKKLSSMSEDQYLSDLESSSIDFEIEDYKVINKDNTDESLLETFTLVSEDLYDEGIIRINPFLYHRVAINPFKLKNRNYPIDFAYPRTYSSTINLEVPKGYKVSKMIEQQGVKLPNNGGRFFVRVNQVENKITLNYRYQIKKKVYSSEEYFYLQKFFNQIVKVHGSFIEFTKL